MSLHPVTDAALLIVRPIKNHTFNRQLNYIKTTSKRMRYDQQPYFTKETAKIDQKQ
ncbi:hypothetical protein JCM19238_3935 [Vibrio ponticus]|nr:hypothetical protein JCM19238_3935 [Vibrio ponticus]